MLLLRSVLFFLGQLIVTPIFTVIALLSFPLPPITRYKLISGWALSMLWWLKVTCNITYKIVGSEHIPKHSSVILAKHQSAWETLAFQAIFPPQVWVMKKSLLWIPFFGWGLAMTSPIAINRAAGREALKQLVEQGKDRLKKGFWVVVFPEGTRIGIGERGKYHIGGAWLANHTNSTVVSVAHNAGGFWPKNSFIKRPGVITVVIAPPIDASKLKTDALNSQVETWIETQMLSL